MMPSSKQFLMLFCLILLPHRAAPSTFESTTINVTSAPRGQSSSSSVQRNCTTSKLKIVHFNIRSLRSPSHLIIGVRAISGQGGGKSFAQKFFASCSNFYKSVEQTRGPMQQHRPYSHMKMARYSFSGSIPAQV